MAISLVKTDGGRQSAGYICESKDCTVRSFAVAADVPYDVAHDVARRSGRKNGKGWWSEKILSVAELDGLVKAISMPLGVQTIGLAGFNQRVIYLTLEQIARKYPKGRYILNTRNHATALIDGKIHDTGLRPRAKVVDIWEVRPVVKVLPPAPITQTQINDLWARLDRLEARS